MPTQLSDVVGAVTVTEHSPVALAIVGATGGSVSTTVTVNEQLAVPALLEAVQRTEVVPTGNAVPEAGVETTVGAGVPVAVTANVTLDEHSPGELLTVMLAGQVIVGSVVALTVSETSVPGPTPTPLMLGLALILAV